MTSAIQTIFHSGIKLNCLKKQVVTSLIYVDSSIFMYNKVVCFSSNKKNLYVICVPNNVYQYSALGACDLKVPQPPSQHPMLYFTLDITRVLSSMLIEILTSSLQSKLLTYSAATRSHPQQRTQFPDYKSKQQWLDVRGNLSLTLQESVAVKDMFLTFLIESLLCSHNLLYIGDQVMHSGFSTIYQLHYRLNRLIQTYSSNMN